MERPEFTWQSINESKKRFEMTQFTLTEKQEKQLKKWQNAIKTVYSEYGNFEYRFRPTGIGDGIEVWSDLAKTTIDLTDVNNW